MQSLPDSDWYFDNVLAYASPGTARIDRPGAAAIWQQWWVERTAPSPGLRQLLVRQGFTATLAQLSEHGISDRRARTRVDRGEWVRPARGVVAPIDIRDEDRFEVRRRRHALDAAAAALRAPDHAVTGRTAAILHGLPVFAVPERPEVTDRRRNGLGRWATAHVRGACIREDEITKWFGVDVSTVPRTLVDVARHDRRSAIMAVDAALRERLVTRSEVDRALARAAGWPGIRQARDVLALADPRAESPLESLARLVLHDDGFPPPDLQVWLGRDRVDMLFEKRRIVLEIDGLGKYEKTNPADEKRRERRLRRRGYRVERLTWDELVRDWALTRRWLRPVFGLPV